MPVNRWTDKADRDLVFAIMVTQMGNESGNIRITATWEQIKAQMDKWGHTAFSKDAMNQRWSKTILKGFKESRDADSSAADGSAAVDTPNAPKTPMSSATKRKGKGAANADGNVDEQVQTPVKRRKRAPKNTAVKIKTEADNEEQTPAKNSKNTPKKDASMPAPPEHLEDGEA